MFTLFREAPSRNTGSYAFNDLTNIRRKYIEQLDDVKQYYHRYPKHVPGSNILGNIIQHIPLRSDLDDYAFVQFAQDRAEGLSRTFGLTSSVYKGKVHEKGITLGASTNEIMLSVSEGFPLTHLRSRWRELTPLRYLYHTRIDTNLPIMNNSTPGAGYGVAVLNIPMMMVQYRHWLQAQRALGVEQVESVYRFIGAFVLPNAIGSFLDIAFFNRLARNALGIGNGSFPLAHPFYLTDLTPRLERVATDINVQAVHRSQDLEQLASATPMLVTPTLFALMAIPRDPITRQNEWALTIARFPYVKYLVQHVLKAAGTDRSQINEVMIALVEAKRDSAFAGFAQTEIVKQLQPQIDQLLQQVK